MDNYLKKNIGDVVKITNLDGLGDNVTVGDKFEITSIENKLDLWLYHGKNVSDAKMTKYFDDDNIEVDVKSKITLTDLEDIIDQIRELEETSDHLHTEALEEKLRYIRKALIHVQVQQKSYMEAIELYTQNLNKSIG